MIDEHRPEDQATENYTLSAACDEIAGLTARITELQESERLARDKLRESNERSERLGVRVKRLEEENRRVRIAHDSIAIKYDQLRGVCDGNGMRTAGPKSMMTDELETALENEQEHNARLGALVVELKARITNLEAAEQPRAWDTHPTDGTEFEVVYQRPESDVVKFYAIRRRVRTVDGYELKPGKEGWRPL